MTAHPIVGFSHWRAPLLLLSGGAGLSGCAAYVARKHCEQVLLASDPERMSECIGNRVQTYNGWIDWFGDLFLATLQAIAAFFS